MATATDTTASGPRGIHITVVVYGALYTQLFIEVGLKNLIALIPEIPETLRPNSLVRIVTTPEDHDAIKLSQLLTDLGQQDSC